MRRSGRLRDVGHGCTHTDLDEYLKRAGDAAVPHLPCTRAAVYLSILSQTIDDFIKCSSLIDR